MRHQVTLNKNEEMTSSPRKRPPFPQSFGLKTKPSSLLGEEMRSQVERIRLVLVSRSPRLNRAGLRNGNAEISANVGGVR